jgi:hypothetical protein
MIYEKCDIDDLTVADLKEVQKWSRRELLTTDVYCGPLTQLASALKCSPELASLTLDLFKEGKIKLPASNDIVEQTDVIEQPSRIAFFRCISCEINKDYS